MEPTVTATIFDKRGRILSKATNSYTKTHPYQKKLSKKYNNGEQIYLHAEINAIIKLKKEKRFAHRIFIERYGCKGNPLLAKPCPICLAAIKKTNIKIIQHT